MDTQNQTPHDPAGSTPGQPSAAGSNSTSPLGTPGSRPPLGAPLNGVTAPPDTTDAGQSPLGTIASGFSSVMGAIFSWIIFPVAVVLILHNFVFQAYHVLGTSMVPTLHETDYLIISKVGYTQALVEHMFHKNTQYIPGRGQIIVFRYPKDPSKVFVKRVVGLPGDRIVIKNGTVTIYNKEHSAGFNPDTSYEKTDTTTLIDTDEVVQDGNLFVMGDNRTPSGSYDSREWGELPSSYIIGHAVLRLLPLDQIRFL
jgi:signal peptidase I